MQTTYSRPLINSAEHHADGRPDSPASTSSFSTRLRPAANILKAGTRQLVLPCVAGWVDGMQLDDLVSVASDISRDLSLDGNFPRRAWRLMAH
jgi:hypothetical protein